MLHSLCRALTLVAVAGFISAVSLHADDRIPIKVIIVSCFEVDEDTGDAPGEFQFFAEREHLEKIIQVPGSPHVLRYNDQGLYGTVSANVKLTPGETPDHLSCVVTSELIMALCLDPKLDLRKTYWIINGIAGIDPLRGSIGSAAWAKNVVDGDAMREIDDTEKPADWPY